MPRSTRGIAIAVIAASLLATGVWAADHFDSPLAKRDVRKDITDVYAFRSPENAANLVVAMNVSSYVPGAAPSPLFDNDARYNIHVDNSDNGSIAADATVEVTFSGTNPQTFEVKGLGTTITGDVGAIVTAGAIKVFCGPRDDPFFFDLTAFQTFVAGPYVPVAGLRGPGAGAPADFFSGRNVGAIILEIPISALTGNANPNMGTIRAWTTVTEPESGI